MTRKKSARGKDAHGAGGRAGRHVRDRVCTAILNDDQRSIALRRGNLIERQRRRHASIEKPDRKSGRAKNYDQTQNAARVLFISGREVTKRAAYGCKSRSISVRVTFKIPRDGVDKRVFVRQNISHQRNALYGVCRASVRAPNIRFMIFKPISRSIILDSANFIQHRANWTISAYYFEYN